MTRRTARVLAFAALMVACSACRRAELLRDDHERIRAVLDEQRDAWNRGDLEAFMQGYHHRPDIVFTSGGKIRRGWDETLASYRTRYAEGGGMGRLSFSDIEITPVGDRAAVVLGHFELTDTPHAGGGVFTLVFERSNGRWAIIHDHSSEMAGD
jgi:uncharacterized protein (TIGR02246 family)